VRTPGRAWGTPLTVTRLRQVLTDDAVHFMGSRPIVVQDISRRGGGELQPHISHQEGRDVDVRLPHRRGARQWGKATPRNIDAERTWFLISALYRTGDLEYIFLDDKLEKVVRRHVLRTYREAPVSQLREIREVFLVIVRHEPGHEYHFHVRFRRGRIGDGHTSKTIALIRKRLADTAVAFR
jgi:penicillin-insensitive murein endopeptidase